MAAETLTADPAPVSRERMAQWLSAMKMPRITAIARSEKANARLMISPLGSISFECRLVRETFKPYLRADLRVSSFRCLYLSRLPS